MPVYLCFDEDNDPQHESPIRIEDADDPTDAAETAAELMDVDGEYLDCREICVEVEDSAEDGFSSSWLLYVVAEMTRDYRARLTMPDFVTDHHADEDEGDEIPT